MLLNLPSFQALPEATAWSCTRSDPLVGNGVPGVPLTPARAPHPNPSNDQGVLPGTSTSASARLKITSGWGNKLKKGHFNLDRAADGIHGTALQKAFGAPAEKGKHSFKQALAPLHPETPRASVRDAGQCQSIRSGRIQRLTAPHFSSDNARSPQKLGDRLQS